MSNTPGADPRQSRTLQKLNRCFDREGVQAWAAIGLVLCEAINAGDLDLPLPKAEATGNMRDALFDLQDCLHGSSENLPAALAAFLDVAEKEVCHD